MREIEKLVIRGKDTRAPYQHVDIEVPITDEKLQEQLKKFRDGVAEHALPEEIEIVPFKPKEKIDVNG